MRSPNHRLTVVLLGASTIIAQALLVREAMAAMGGSEVAWGIVMALWLGGMGLGARLGVSLGTPRMVRWLPASVLLLAAAGILLFRAAPSLLGASTGETLTTFSALWLWAAAVVPAAVGGGLGFPALAEAIGGTGGGRAYALEATGALVGGVVLTGVLIGRGTAAALILCLAVVAAAPLWRRHRRVLLAIVFAGAGAAFPVGDWLAHTSWKWAHRPQELHSWRETRLQRLEISDGEQRALYADGRLLAAYPDPYSVLPRAHLLMLLHPEPRRVLAVGGAADGSVEAMILHPVDSLTLVEEDPTLLALIPSWFGSKMAAALGDPRVRPSATDPIRALRSAGTFDLILLLDGHPTTLRRNRTRTLEFLRLCRRHLADDGILVLRIPVADTYLGGTSGRLVATLLSTVDEVFPQREIVPGEEILVIAGGDTAQIEISPDGLADRLITRGLEAALLPEMIPVLVDRERARDLEDRLQLDIRANTVDLPVAVLMAAALHEGRGGRSLLRLAPALESSGPRFLLIALAIAMVVLAVPCFVPRSPAMPTAAVIGFGSMGWWLLLLAAWQVTRGSVYSEVGALTALFMGGVAGGAAWGTRWSQPMTQLTKLLGGSVILSGLVASSVALRVPVIAVPALLVAGGALTGAAFPALAQLAGRGTRRGAGTVFAADEIGAALAALTVGVVAVPTVGLAATAAGLAALQLAAIPAVLAHTRAKEARK